MPRLYEVIMICGHDRYPDANRVYQQVTSHEEAWPFREPVTDDEVFFTTTDGYIRFYSPLLPIFVFALFLLSFDFKYL